MKDIIANGIKDGKEMTVEAELTDNGIELLFNKEVDFMLEGEILEAMKEHHPFAGTYYPQTEKLNLLTVLEGYFFDKCPDITVNGELEQVPYEEGVIY